MTTMPGDSDAVAQPRARLPRVRFGVRAILLVVAASALAMLTYVEFKDGSPPRFVIRAIPGRIAKLKPGMPRSEVRQILGLGRPWHYGGTGDSKWQGFYAWPVSIEDHSVRPRGIAAAIVPIGGMGPLTPETIRLQYRMVKGGTLGEADPDRQDDRLMGARFADASGAVAEMPGSSRSRYDIID